MLRDAGCHAVVLLLDFEARPEPYDQFLTGLSDEISTRGYPVPVHVCALNRMIENWFLADIAHLSSRKNFLRKGIRQKNFEGRDGKKDLRSMFARGFTYSEVNHGPQMFRELRLNVARHNSTSFAHFLSELGM
jgi:hypothetical protein